MAASGTVIGGTAYANRFLYTGREYVSNLALYNLRNRFYSPALGRFLQPDPIGQAGDWYSLYRYCGNNPVNSTDVAGLYTGWDDAAFSLAGGLAAVAGEIANRAAGGETTNYGAVFVGGAVAGEMTLYGMPTAGGAVGGLITSAIQERIDGKLDGGKLAMDTAKGAAFGFAGGKLSESLTQAIGSGARNGVQAITKSTVTKLRNATISQFANSTLRKMSAATLIDQSQAAMMGGFMQGKFFPDKGEKPGGEEGTSNKGTTTGGHGGGGVGGAGGGYGGAGQVTIYADAPSSGWDGYVTVGNEPSVGWKTVTMGGETWETSSDGQWINVTTPGDY